MFQIRSNAASYRARFSQALDRLPGAHRHAASQAISHLRGGLERAAQEMGWEPEDSLGVAWVKETPWVSIARSTAGDRVFDNEFGHLGKAPNPVLRNTAKALQESAHTIYASHLSRGLWFS